MAGRWARGSGWAGSAVHAAPVGHCRRGDAFACETIHGATGVTRDGGYATRMLALVSALAHVSEALDPVASAPLLCAASPPSTRCGTAARNRATWWRSMGSAASATLASNSPQARGSAPRRSIGGATRRPWHGRWAHTTTSTARRAIRPRHRRRWAAPRPSSPPLPTPRQRRRSWAASGPMGP